MGRHENCPFGFLRHSFDQFQVPHERVSFSGPKPTRIGAVSRIKAKSQMEADTLIEAEAASHIEATSLIELLHELMLPHKLRLNNGFCLTVKELRLSLLSTS